MTTQRRLTALAAILTASTLIADSGTWNAITGGDWSVPTNWDSAPAIPNGPADTATIPTGAYSIYNDLPGLTLLGLSLGGTGHTLTGSTIALGADGITVTEGAHAIGAPLAINGPSAITVAPNQDLALNGPVTTSGDLTVTGGRLTLGGANTFGGPVRQITGLISFSDPAALGTSDPAAANLILGEGTLRYTGGTDTLDRGFTFHPGAEINRASVIDITDPAATLTVTGQVLTDGGAFIKTGPGTLKLAYPGFQELARGRYGSQTGIIEYDADGIPATNRYSSFVVDQGTLILGGPDQDNLLYAGWVGSRNDYSPRLDIIGGRTRFVNDYFTIGRGTGSRESVQSPSMHVSGGSTVTLEGSGFVMANAQGKDGNHFCRPVLTVSQGSTFTVNNHVLLGENGNATSRVDVTGGSAFISNHQGYDRGMIVSTSDNADTTVTFDNASTHSAYLMRIARNGRVTYQGDSLLEFDSTTLATSALHTQGTVTFNGATLRQRTPARSADWFAGHADFLVGDNGLTIRADSYAWLAPAIRPAPGAATATATKTGPGTLAIQPPQIPLTVAEGTLALAADRPNVNPTPSAPVTVLPGATLQVSGANILDAVPITASTLNLTAQSLTSHPENWYYRDSAQLNRTDGHLRLTHDFGGTRGAAFLFRKRTVTAPWTATFTYRAHSRGTTPADGIAFVIHNDPAGNNAIGASAGSLGYETNGTTNAPGFANSVAIGIAGYYRTLLLGKQSAFITTNTVLPTLGNNGAAHHVTISYDGAGTLTATVERPDRNFRHTQSYPVNLAHEINADEATIGFTGATGGSTAQHTVTDFTFTQGTAAPSAPAPARLGGDITLGASETLNARLNPNPAQNGFALRALTYGPGATLNITAQSPAAAPNALPPIDIADKGLWQFNGTTHWNSDGSFTLNTNLNSDATGGQIHGSAFTTNRYSVSGNWTARIGYSRGLASGSPADYVSFVIQTSGPTLNSDGAGLAIRWHYYDGTIQTTQIKTIINGAATTHDGDISPINFKADASSVLTVTYNAPAKTLTVTTVQNEHTHTIDIPDIDIAKILNSTEAHIGFYGRIGGQYAENIITSIAFESATARPEPATSVAPAYLAIDTLTGTGPLTVTGGAALGFTRDPDAPSSTDSLILQDSGIHLRKTALEPLDQNLGPRSDWLLSAVGTWAPSNTMQICDSINNTNGTATSTRRIHVTGSWTADFDFTWGSNINSPADAFCLFLHNDPRGPGISEGNADSSGYHNMKKSIALRWYFYPGNESGNKNTVALGRDGTWLQNTRDSYEPVTFYSNLVTHVTVRHDATANTLTSIIRNDLGTVTNTFQNVNIQDAIDHPHYAHVGLGGATGGVNAKMRIMDFRFQSDTTTDPDASQPPADTLGTVTIPDGATGYATLDSPAPDSAFSIAALGLGQDAAFTIQSPNANPTVLALTQVILDGTGTLNITAPARAAVATVTGTGDLTKRGTGTLTLTGEADYTGDTRLEAGTLTLPSPNLPTSTDLHVTDSAILNLPFTGKQIIHALTIDGIPQPGGAYTSAKVPWITGPGTLIVTYPPTGTLLFLK